MNNIIGNTPYRNIQNKKYIDSTAEYIGKLADFLDKEQIPYSGRISEYKSTITVSGKEPWGTCKAYPCRSSGSYRG